MTIPWEAVGSWPVRVLVTGGAVLLVGRVLVALARQPARRVWVGTAAVVAALLAIPLSLLLKALLVDSDRRAAWLRPLIGDPYTPPADASAAQTATDGTPDQREAALPRPDHLE